MTKHECSFSFEKNYKRLYEPKKGETGFSIKRDDWVCKCGRTRREYLGLKSGQGRTSKIKSFVESVNTWEGMRAERMGPVSPERMKQYLIAEGNDIEEIIIIKRVKGGKKNNGN